MLTAVIYRDGDKAGIENVVEDAVMGMVRGRWGIDPGKRSPSPRTAASTASARTSVTSIPIPTAATATSTRIRYALRDPQGTITFPDGVQVSSDVTAFEEFERQYDRIEQRQIERKQALAAA